MSDKEHAKSKREEQKAFKVHEYAMLKCRIEAENLESGVIMLRRCHNFHSHNRRGQDIRRHHHYPIWGHHATKKWRIGNFKDFMNSNLWFYLVHYDLMPMQL
jgi:hypothetical protein